MLKQEMERAIYAALLAARDLTLTIDELVAQTRLDIKHVREYVLTEALGSEGLIGLEIPVSGGPKVTLTSMGEYLARKARYGLAERMKEHYKDAIMSQSACNFGAIVHSLSRAMKDIRDDSDDKVIGHEKHPICRLYLEQFTNLVTGGQMAPDDGPNKYHDAYAACKSGAGEE